MLIPFEKGHLSLMNVRERECKMLNTVSTQEFCNAVKALTVIEIREDGFFMILGILGIRNMWQGVADIFMIPCADLSKHNVVAFVRQVKNAMIVAAEEYNIRRFQTVAVNDDLHNRWLRHIGFVEEGLMVQYSIDKEDYKLWALR